MRKLRHKRAKAAEAGFGPRPSVPEFCAHAVLLCRHSYSIYDGLTHFIVIISLLLKYWRASSVKQQHARILACAAFPFPPTSG